MLVFGGVTQMFSKHFSIYLTSINVLNNIDVLIWLREKLPTLQKQPQKTMNLWQWEVAQQYICLIFLHSFSWWWFEYQWKVLKSIQKIPEDFPSQNILKNPGPPKRKTYIGNCNSLHPKAISCQEPGSFSRVSFSKSSLHPRNLT